MRPASILEFLGDALDIWPVMDMTGRSFRPTYRRADPHEQDAIAIRSDWEAVGRDLALASLGRNGDE